MKADPPPRRPWKGVLFHCCGVYGRIYQSVQTGLFSGNCPKCGKPLSLFPSLQNIGVVGLLVLFLLGLTHPISAQTPANSNTPKSSLLDQDSVLIGGWFGLGFGFLGFGDRSRFELEAEQRYRQYLSQATRALDSSLVRRQRYQQVNFAFPLGAGLSWQVRNDHYLGLAAEFLHRREAVILTDRNGDSHELFYALQAIPLSLEYRVRISPNLISLRDQDHFAFAARWIWLAPGTEIYSSSGVLQADPEWLGHGWGLSLGYRLGEFFGIRISGQLGYTQLRAHSSSPWSRVVADTTATHAKWNLGGLSLQLRGQFRLASLPPSRLRAAPNPDISDSLEIPSDSTQTSKPEFTGFQAPPNSDDQGSAIPSADAASEEDKAKALERATRLREQLEQMKKSTPTDTPASDKKKRLK